MIRFQAFGVRFKLPLLSVLMPILAARLGVRTHLPALSIALAAHELAHILAARVMRVPIAEIRLTPFGGSARMENPYSLTPMVLCAVAIAGPIANLLLMLAFASAAQWGLLSPATAAAHVQINLMLMLFNLVPALPLDGGRMLYAAFSAVLGERNSMQLGVYLGRLLAGFLLAIMVWGGIRSGQWNLTFLLTAVFLIASARDEMDALHASKASRLLDLCKQDGESRPIRILQMPPDATVSQAIAQLQPQRRTWFAIANQKIIDDHGIIEFVQDGGTPEALLKELRGFQLSPANASGISE